MTLAIGEMSERDRPALIELWVAAWTAAMPEIDFGARREWLADHLDSLLANGCSILVARFGDVLAGFLTVDETGYVDQLAVDVSWQGRGVGGSLIQAARSRAGRSLHLAVNAANLNAVRFYRRLGFADYGETTNPSSGLPVLLMRADL